MDDREPCGTTCTLCTDVVAATYAPHEPAPRELRCELDHPHPGKPHTAEGWAWWNGQIWLVGEGEMVPLVPVSR